MSEVKEKYSDATYTFIFSDNSRHGYLQINVLRVKY